MKANVDCVQKNLSFFWKQPIGIDLIGSIAYVPMLTNIKDI